MDKAMKVIAKYNAMTSQNIPCVIMEFESTSNLMKWRIESGISTNPWLRKIDEKTFIDDKTGERFTLTD